MNNQVDNTKVLVVEERVNGHEVRIEKLESETNDLSKRTDSLSKLEAILEMQVAINKSQSISIENQNKQSQKTFNAINQNLTQLNMFTERLKEDFDESTNYSKAEIQAIRKKIEDEENKRKIDTGEWGVKIFYSLAALIPMIILAWILYVNGWN